MRAGPLFSPFWLGAWATALAMGWLLPNHNPPWATFHSDAWISAILLIGLVAVLARSGEKIRWSGSHLMILVMLPMPMVQHLTGMIPFVGEAWTATANLLGLLLALHLGSTWESKCPGQCLDGLALAIGLAGIVSVGVQLVQWSGPGALWLLPGGEITWRVWIVDFGGGRAYGNLAQPNMMGTLLLWAVLSVVWGTYRQKLRAISAVSLTMFLLTGVALTQSRTAWLGVAILVVASWCWSHLWRNRWVPLVATGAGLYFAVLTALLVAGFDLTSELGTRQISETRVEVGQRPAAWWMFINAALAQPWLGYGWNQGMVAHLAVAELFPALNGVFNYSHNLFLDLVIWFGIPIGLLLSMALSFWMTQRITQVRTPEAAIAVLFLVVVGIHSMLEFPLHYAYLMFPAGVMVGILSVGPAARIKFDSHPVHVLALALIAAALGAFIVRDYLGRIEQNFLALRFESQRIGNLPAESTPKVLVLTQLREWLRFARFNPRDGMSDGEVQWARDTAWRYPMPSNLFKLALILAMNGKLEEASAILIKARQVVSIEHWQEIRNSWLVASKGDPRVADVQLPH